MYMIDKNKIIRKDRKSLKSIVMTIRTTKETSDFMKQKNISPTLLFNEAIKEIIAGEKKHGKK